MCLFLTLWHASGHELCLEFIWLKNKLPKAVVTFKSPSLICCPVQHSTHLKKEPENSAQVAGSVRQEGVWGEELFRSKAASEGISQKFVA